MTGATPDREGFARTALSFVAEPGDLVAGALLRAGSPAEAFAAICDGRPPETVDAAGRGGIPGLARAIERWVARLGSVPTDARLAAWQRAGMRVVCPGTGRARLLRRIRQALRHRQARPCPAIMAARSILQCIDEEHPRMADMSVTSDPGVR
jgi:hypothetical protein